MYFNPNHKMHKLALYKKPSQALSTHAPSNMSNPGLKALRLALSASQGIWCDIARSDRLGLGQRYGGIMPKV